MIKNKLQSELYNYIVENRGDCTLAKSFTPEMLNQTPFRDYSVRQIRYNLNKLVKLDVGIYEGYGRIKNYCYSTGYYYINEK